MNVKNDADRLVDDYLRRLAEAAEPLPEGRRTELVGEVTAHIAEARAEGAESEAEVREMLTRLGSPAEIVAAATDGLVLVEQSRLRSREGAALLLLMFGGFFFLFGWFVGVVLLWISDRWTTREKWVGTLLWPFGYAFPGFLLTYIPMDMPSWLAWPGWIVLVGGQTAIVSLLFQNARPGRSTAG